MSDVHQSLSQEKLALNADVDRTYVSHIERAAGSPSLLVLSKLASILDSMWSTYSQHAALTLLVAETPDVLVWGWDGLELI